MSKAKVLKALKEKKVRLTNFEIEILMFFLSNSKDHQVTTRDWNNKAVKMKGPWMHAGAEIDNLLDKEIIKNVPGGSQVTDSFLLILNSL